MAGTFGVSGRSKGLPMITLDTVYLLGVAVLLWRALVTMPVQSWEKDFGVALAVALWPVCFTITVLLAALLAARQAGVWPMIAFMPSLFVARLRDKFWH